MLRYAGMTKMGKQEGSEDEVRKRTKETAVLTLYPFQQRNRDMMRVCGSRPRQEAQPRTQVPDSVRRGRGHGQG